MPSTLLEILHFAVTMDLDPKCLASFNKKLFVLKIRRTILRFKIFDITILTGDLLRTKESEKY